MTEHPPIRRSREHEFSVPYRRVGAVLGASSVLYAFRMGAGSTATTPSAWERVSIPIFVACPLVMLVSLVFLSGSVAGTALVVAAAALMVWIRWSTRDSQLWRRASKG